MSSFLFGFEEGQEREVVGVQGLLFGIGGANLRKKRKWINYLARMHLY